MWLNKSILFLSAPLTILFIVFYLIILNPIFYNFKLSNDNFFAIHPLNKREIINNIFGYLNNQENITSNYFSQTELHHLSDLKKLGQRLSIITIGFFITTVVSFLTIYTKRGKMKYPLIIMAKSLFFFGLLMLLCLLLVSRNFEFFFLTFHKFSFSNNYWQLDPNVDVLINVFPPKIFYQLITNIFITVILIDFIGSSLAYWLYKKQNLNEKK
ncbi:MAG: DUF1461 domain-containing protein [Patescibacteria group bacterium]|nr:DUF1461 domain-containing protein [Patescibacteria group bacterium]